MSRTQLPSESASQRTLYLAARSDRDRIIAVRRLARQCLDRQSIAATSSTRALVTDAGSSK
eukprot:2634012-Heterocapsa_arctica.AAC.1